VRTRSEIFALREQIVDAIVQHRIEYRVCPTLREIAEVVGVPLGTLYEHLLSLKREKRVAWESHKLRTLREIERAA
jgi:hypothetical protein